MKYILVIILFQTLTTTADRGQVVEFQIAQSYPSEDVCNAAILPTKKATGAQDVTCIPEEAVTRLCHEGSCEATLWEGKVYF